MRFATQRYLVFGSSHASAQPFISRTLHAIQIPRSKLEQAAQRTELSNVGVYLLFGSDAAKPRVYVGEAENCLSRLKQHNKQKDFWSQAIAFISKTQHFTKTHIKYLEWLCYDTALRVNRYTVENGNTPGKPHVQESVEADLLDNFDSMQLLVSTLGYPVFDEIKKPNNAHLVYCKGKNANAEGEYSEEGLTVFKGSTCNLRETPSSGNWVVSARSDLIDAGTLNEIDGVLVFQEDHVFSSPSTAAVVVLARRANGWMEWKYKTGRTLDEVIRQTPS